MCPILPRAWKIALPCIFLVFAANSARAGQKEVLRQARAAYYSLRVAGFAGYTCVAKPDWSFFAASISDEESRGRILPTLRQVTFNISVNGSGEATVSHSAYEEPADSDTADAVKRIVGGLQQVISGFFQSWQGFMITPMFPDPGSPYQLEDRGKDFKLVYKEDKVGVQIIMDRQYAITDLLIKLETVDVTLHPKFETDGGRYVLAGYDFENAQHTGEKDTGSISIENHLVEGLILPVRLTVKMMVDSAQVQPAFDFTDFVIQKP